MIRSEPGVSAIVPCYNSEKTIYRCINSILAQTRPVKEILVYDDSSSDQTPTILAQLAEKHGCIRVLSGTENLGAGYARSRLLEVASGDFFAFLDSDDTWHPRKLEVQLELMNQSGADICVCDYAIFNGDGDRVGERRLPLTISRFRMHLQNEIPTSMAVLRSDLMGCRTMPELRRRQDYAYWLSIFSLNPELKCISARDILGSYYRIPGSLSSSMIVNLKANYEMFRKTQGYSALLSTICVGANISSRLIRLVK